MTPTEADALDRRDMERLRSGDEAGLDDLMARHARPLFGFLCRFVGDEDAANDLAQEAFIRVYQNRGSFETGMRFSPWLFTIAGNLARNHLRSRSRRPEVSLDANAPDDGPSLQDRIPASGRQPDECALRDEQAAEVRGAVADLPDDLRAAVVLCELEDRSVAEAAGLLATTVKAIESRLYRARKQLREQLTRLLAKV